MFNLKFQFDPSRLKAWVENEGVDIRLLSARSMNFGQHWRTLGVIEHDYKLRVPFDELAAWLANPVEDLLNDFAKFPDDDALCRALSTLPAPIVPSLFRNSELFVRTLEYFSYDLLLDMLNDLPQSTSGFYVLNTVESITRTDDDSVLIAGIARDSTIPVNVQDV